MNEEPSQGQQSKASELNEIQIKNLESLEKKLATLGRNGREFVPRTYKEKRIDNDDYLALLDEIAKDVTSVPYSAVVLASDKEGKLTLYIAQNKDNYSDKETEQKLEKNEAYINLKNKIKDLEVKMCPFDRNAGNHPDAVAINAAIEGMGGYSGERSERVEIHLGLASFEENGDSKGQSPASCACCDAVIYAFSKKGYDIKVSLSTLTNFPKNGNYKIPPIIIDNPDLRDLYLSKITNNVLSLQEALQNEKEAYIQYLSKDKIPVILSDPDKDKTQKNEEIEELKNKIRDNYTKLKEGGKTRTSPLLQNEYKSFQQAVHGFDDQIIQTIRLIPVLYTEKFVSEKCVEQQKYIEEYKLSLEQNNLEENPNILEEQLEELQKTLSEKKQQKENLENEKKPINKNAENKEKNEKNTQDYNATAKKLAEAEEEFNKATKELKEAKQANKNSKKASQSNTKTPKTKKSNVKQEEPKQQTIKPKSIQDLQARVNMAEQNKKLFRDRLDKLPKPKPSEQETPQSEKNTNRINKEVGILNQEIGNLNQTIGILNKIIEKKNRINYLNNFLPEKLQADKSYINEKSTPYEIKITSTPNLDRPNITAKIFDSRFDPNNNNNQLATYTALNTFELQQTIPSNQYQVPMTPTARTIADNMRGRLESQSSTSTITHTSKNTKGLGSSKKAVGWQK